MCMWCNAGTQWTPVFAQASTERNPCGHPNRSDDDDTGISAFVAAVCRGCIVVRTLEAVRHGLGARRSQSGSHTFKVATVLTTKIGPW